MNWMPGAAILVHFTVQLQNQGSKQAVQTYTRHRLESSVLHVGPLSTACEWGFV